MELGLKDRVALVAAASKGMGKACALGLAAEGAKVVMFARTAPSWRRPPRRSGARPADMRWRSPPT